MTITSRYSNKLSEMRVERWEKKMIPVRRAILPSTKKLSRTYRFLRSSSCKANKGNNFTSFECFSIDLNVSKNRPTASAFTSHGDRELVFQTLTQNRNQGENPTS